MIQFQINTTTRSAPHQPPQATINPPPFEAVEQIELREPQAAAAIDIDNLNSTSLQAQVEPPPDYDGPIPIGANLLAVVKIDFESKPTFFSPQRPARLEDKIPNLTYLNRINELNDKLNTEESLKSMEYFKRFRWIGLGILVLCLIVSFSLFMAIGGTSGAYAFIIMLIPGMYGLSLSTDVKYIGIVQEFAKKWTQEDDGQGVNLFYDVKKIQGDSKDFGRINIQLLVFERLGVMGDAVRNVMGENLPEYASSTISYPPPAKVLGQAKPRQEVAFDNDTAAFAPEASPTYYGPVPAGTVFVWAVPMNFDKEPTFFDTNCPDRLEAKANITPTSTVLGLALFVVFTAKAVILFFVFKSQLTFALLMVPIAYVSLVPMNAKCGNTTSTFQLKKWTEEDSHLGKSLVYQVQKKQPSNQQTRINVVLLIFEKTTLAEPIRRTEEEDLPSYM
ncbi:hypothetical protein HDU79_003411 [Rhizoclosmatium sp. JEL0117]|nr:hypothetical protein HDU79_003411 [Rhizoclosmatium sp. JEL0117]